MIHEVDDLSGTVELGRRLGALLFPGAVVALVGPLGAGKTQLVRAIAEGLGIADSRAVSSPTFVLIQEYAARLPIYHFDAYRLRAAEFADLGAHEYFQGNGVCLVEWADRVTAQMPAEHLRITIAVTGESRRRFTLEAHGAAHQELLTRLTAGLHRDENRPTVERPVAPGGVAMKEAVVIVVAIAAGCLAGQYFTRVEQPRSPHPIVPQPAEEAAKPAESTDTANEPVVASSADQPAFAAEEDEGEAPRIISTSSILGRSAPTSAPPAPRSAGSRPPPRAVPSLPQPRQPTGPGGRC
jgi:tRNA threonylcarbamoyladenosine biosynthesis protein TsaE